MKEPKELKGTKHDGAWKVTRSDLYHSHRIIVRQFKEYYFEYLTEYNGEIYSGYIIIKPEGKSRRKLTEMEVSEATALIYNGAVTTLDMLLGIKIDEEAKATAELFEENREKFEKKEKDGK